MPCFLLPTNPHKSLPGHTPNTLKIKLLNHRPELFLLKPCLPKLARNAAQVFQVDKALLALVEQLESAQDLVARIPLQDLQGCDGLEGGERHEEVGRVLRVCAGVLGRLGRVLALLLLDLRARHTVGCEEGDEFLFCEGEAEGAEGDAQLVVV